MEAHNSSGGLYGNERLEKILNRTGDCPGEQVLHRILKDVHDFSTEVPQFDDITMIVLTQ